LKDILRICLSAQVLKDILRIVGSSYVLSLDCVWFETVFFWLAYVRRSLTTVVRT
jgi:hypothetical protein